MNSLPVTHLKDDRDDDSIPIPSSSSSHPSFPSVISSFLNLVHMTKLSIGTLLVTAASGTSSLSSSSSSSLSSSVPSSSVLSSSPSPSSRSAFPVFNARTRLLIVGFIVILLVLGDTFPTATGPSSSSSLRPSKTNNGGVVGRTGASASGGYFSCTTSEQIQEGIEAVRKATSGRRVNKVGGAPYSVAEYHALHPCTRYNGVREPSWYDKDGEWIGYLVLSSEAYRDRLALQLETWGSVIPSKWFRSYSDVNDPALHMLTLPDLEGKPDYHQAQHRVLKGLQHAVDDPEWAMAEFIIILGDDTYINVPELRLFTAQWNPDIPVMFGWIWHRSYGSWPGGGSGMLFTRAAAQMIAQALYTSVCPFEGHDDVTLGYCCWRLGIPQVHSPLFDTMGEYFRWFDKPLQNPSGVLSIISIHKTTKERMYTLHSLFHGSNQVSEDNDGTGNEHNTYPSDPGKATVVTKKK